MATITINGTLVNDQSAGLQNDDDKIGTALNALDGLAGAFQTFLSDSELLANKSNIISAGQKAFRGNVEAVISDATFVTVNPQGSSVSDLFFSNAAGKDLAGDQVIFDGKALQTVGGQDIYLWSFGNFALATTSNVAASKG